MRLNFPQNCYPLSVLVPGADAGGRTGPAANQYISLKGAVKAWIFVYITQGAANTVLLSPLQATAIANTGSKAINATRIWVNLDVAAGNDFTAATEAATYTTDAGVKNKIVIFEIDMAKTLDVAGGFDCIAISTGASAAANITSALCFIQPKYSGATITPNPLLD